MAWLVTHMWMVLAGATVFALLLGWSFRGMLLTGKMRKAIVDKDVALTELDQARDEIERLFAAQRAQRGEGGEVADASARKISDLTAELQKAKTELTTLKAEAEKAASAPPAEAPVERDAPTIVLPPNRGGPEEDGGEGDAPAAESEATEPPTLTWRNRHLEARVKQLEAQLAEIQAAPAAEPEAAPAVVTEETPAAEAALSVDEEGLAKLRWQADYLKQRVEGLEAELAKAPAEVPVAAEEDTNEEMARLRWRNRFLEGRLAYFEGGAGEAAAEPVAEKTGAEAMLEQLEVTDTAADMTEAVEAMAGELTVAEMPAEDEPDFVVADSEEDEEASFETLVETEIADVEVTTEDEPVPAEEDEPEDVVEKTVETVDAEPDEDSFEDVSNDEEESLAEADHADEDVLSDEEYDEEDFVASDDGEDEYDADADETDEFDDEAEAEADEAPDELEEDEPEEYGATGEEAGGDFEIIGFDDGERDDEGDAVSEEDEAYDDAEDFDEIDDESDAAEDDASDEEDDVSDEAWDEDDVDTGEVDAPEETGADAEEDESSEEEVTYEADESVTPERPMAMNGPVEGHPDDLTLIGGIGPKIQVLLNELGVWHYDQIAEWTPENVAWVDDHLNFGGRITREGWVEQAAVLVRDAESV